MSPTDSKEAKVELERPEQASVVVPKSRAPALFSLVASSVALAAFLLKVVYHAIPDWAVAQYWGRSATPPAVTMCSLFLPLAGALFLLLWLLYRARGRWKRVPNSTWTLRVVVSVFALCPGMIVADWVLTGGLGSPTSHFRPTFFEENASSHGRSWRIMQGGDAWARATGRLAPDRCRELVARQSRSTMPPVGPPSPEQSPFSRNRTVDPLGCWDDPTLAGWHHIDCNLLGAASDSECFVCTEPTAHEMQGALVLPTACAGDAIALLVSGMSLLSMVDLLRPSHGEMTAQQ